MEQIAWLRSHVERCMQMVWDDADLETDGDGDYGFRSDSCLGWIRISEQRPLIVTVYAWAATGLKSSAKLLREVNEINGQARGPKIYLIGECVIVEQAVLASSLDFDSFHYAVRAVCSIADDIGPMLAAVYGGSTCFPAELSDAE